MKIQCRQCGAPIWFARKIKAKRKSKEYAIKTTIDERYKRWNQVEAVFELPASNSDKVRKGMEIFGVSERTAWRYYQEFRDKSLTPLLEPMSLVLSERQDSQIVDSAAVKPAD